jgi:hypothetical protein
MGLAASGLETCWAPRIDWHGSDTADVFFDTVPSDYIVHRRVQSSLQRVDGLQQGLHALGTALGQARLRLLKDVDEKLG